MDWASGKADLLVSVLELREISESMIWIALKTAVAFVSPVSHFPNAAGAVALAQSEAVPRFTDQNNGLRYK